jgi:hypothetical protein
MRYVIIRPNSRINHGSVCTHAVVEGEYNNRPGEGPYTSVALCGTVWSYGTSRWVSLGVYSQYSTIVKKITCRRCLRSFDKMRKKP